MSNLVCGFTLIELLVVIAIIGLLSSIVFASISNARVRARDTRRIVDLREIAKALELHDEINGSYPTGCSWSSAACWTTFLNLYISPTPVDPLNTTEGTCGSAPESTPDCHLYRYCPLNNQTGFALAVNLESSPATVQADHATCKTGGPNYYWLEVL